jgi:spore germination protein
MADDSLTVLPDPFSAANQAPTPDVGRWRQRRRRRQVMFAIIAVLAVMVGVYVTTLRRTDYVSSYRPIRLIGALPYWSIAGDSKNVLAHAKDFTTITPWIYGIDDQGGITSLVQDSSGATHAALAKVEASKVEIVPSISNTQNGNWDYPAIIHILRSPTLQARHIDNIVHLVVRNNLRGIDIDYEELQAQDRTVFTRFIRALARELHDAGRTLSVDVFAKTSDRGYDSRNIAQDYHAIGAAADTVRIMAYDWHWASSEPGPIAPIGWVRDVLNYARTQIPLSKIALGVPAYGYDWVGNHGEPVSWLQVYGLLQKYGSPVQWDNSSQSPWMTYTAAGGAKHVVWFENAYSALAKLALAQNMHVAAAYLWLAGDEDDLLWRSLSASSIARAAKSAAHHQKLIEP